MTTKKSKIIAGSALAAVLLLQGSLAFADDTEIFITRGNSDINPNIFFVLDNSGSMNWCLDKQKVICEKNPPSRMDVLKKTMVKLLDKMKERGNIRFGMMSLNYRNKIATPIKNIEEVHSKAKKKINNRITVQGSTPIASSLYDAARYINGFQNNDSFPERPKNFPGRNSKNALKIEAESPIIESCQPTHLVLLTDGEPSKGRIDGDIKKLIGKNKCAKRSSMQDGTCVPELAKWLHETDQSPLPGRQTVTVHTIAFALKIKGYEDKSKNAEKFLREVASAGGGRYYTANNAEQLSEVFDNILQVASDMDNATFVSPTSSPDASKKNQQQLYYTMFLPTSSDRWPGNLKSYQLGRIAQAHAGKKTTAPAILDANGNEAFDKNGYLKQSARSFWSEQADGASVTQGGAASKLPKPGLRHLYFSEGNSLRLFDPIKMPQALQGKIKHDRWAILLHYIQGAATDGETPRNAMGDLLHSHPVVLNYADMQTLIVGSNEGFVHLFDQKTGIEQFAFMPEALLKNISQLYENAPSTKEKPHPYGMDNTVTLWIEDKNNNGKADPGEQVYAHASMRRGGRNLYALDISNRENPKLAWQIIGGKDKGFEHLGQTWSQPIKTKINVKGKATDVLIFGGGYDPVEDNFNGKKDGYATGVSMGNDIYIVDAKSGKKLWSAKASALNLDNMKYSIPARLRVLVNKDGLAEQFFAADTGGQIWRFAIDNESDTDDFVSPAAQHGLFASLGGKGAANARRFYHEPDVALDASGAGLIVNIGSGYHAHPLNTNIEDRFYSLHTTRQSSVKTATLTEENLANVTEHLTAEMSDAAISERQGWYIKLRRKGEKVLSPAVSVRGELFFTTYVPSTSKISCQVTQGSNFGYHVFAQNAVPAEVDSLLDTPAGFLAKREEELSVSGFAATSVLSASSNGEIPVLTGNKIKVVKANLCNKLTPLRGCKIFWMDLSPAESLGTSAP